MQVNECNYPGYVFKVGEGWKRGRVVLLALVADETQVTLDLLMNAFIEVHGGEVKCRLTQYMFSDGDEKLIEAVKRMFPWVIHLLCHFHVGKVIIVIRLFE